MAQRAFLTRLLAGGLLLAAVASCAVNPVSGERELMLMSEAEEQRLGAAADADVRRQYGVYPDRDLQAYVERVGQQLAAKSHRPGLEYHFTVLDSDEVNAFALPGGYVYVTRGIMAYLNSEAELAAVLGHEIGHVTARHGARRYSQAQALGVGLGVASIFVPGMGSDLGQQLLDALGSAILNGYGRDHELESDRLGAEYLARSGYDPQAMIGVITLLKNQEEYEKARAAAENRRARVYHGVFATHPSADQRLHEAVGGADRLKGAAATRVARADYLQRLDGVVFGESEAQGIVRGRRFYHGALDFTIEFPEGWRLDNRPAALLAVAPGDAALLQLTSEPARGTTSARAVLEARVRFAAPAREAGALAGAAVPAYSARGPLDTGRGRREARVSALLHRDQAYLLLGLAADDAAFARHDNDFLASARSLRALRAEERSLARGLHLKLRAATRGDTFATLARSSPLGAQAEAQLRLLNDRYPHGEPRPGEPIKIVQ
jgi:predicted Zn-dependent protease